MLPRGKAHQVGRGEGGVMIALLIVLLLATPAYALRPEATASATINDIVRAVRLNKPGLCFAHSVVAVGLLNRLGYRSAMMGLFNSDGEMYHAYISTQDFGTIDIYPEANPTPELIGYGTIIQHIYYDKVKNSFKSQIDKALERLVFMLIRRRLDEIEMCLTDDMVFDKLADIQNLVHMCDTPLKLELEDKILNKLVPFGAYLKRNGQTTERVVEAYERFRAVVGECYRDWLGYRPRNINRLFQQAA